MLIASLLQCEVNLHLHVVGNWIVIKSSRLVLPPANRVFSCCLQEWWAGEHLFSGYISVWMDVHFNDHITLNTVLLCNRGILRWCRRNQSRCFDVRNRSGS